MSELTWDDVGEREFETGVDHGVLYIPTDGVYDTGVAWNGLTAVTESPSGAEANPLYADNIKYLNLISAEQFGGTIEAFTYPDEFAQFDGQQSPTPGVSIGQQRRGSFGFGFRTRLGNDVDGDDFGYKLHLVYGATAAPSEKAYATVNESPEAITFSWEISTIPVPVPDLRPTSLIVINSTEVNPARLAELEVILYGDVSTDPRLPMPAEVISILDGAGLTLATPVVPTLNGTTGVLTIPTVTGLTYTINDTIVTGTVQLVDMVPVLVVATLNTGYKFPTTAYDSDWAFTWDEP